MYSNSRGRYGTAGGAVEVAVAPDEAGRPHHAGTGAGSAGAKQHRQQRLGSWAGSAGVRYAMGIVLVTGCMVAAYSASVYSSYWTTAATALTVRIRSRVVGDEGGDETKK